MKDTAELHIVLKATGKRDNLTSKHLREWRINYLDTAQREAFFLDLEDYVLSIASKERRDNG
jgi:hypothetical protein